MKFKWFTAAIMVCCVSAAHAFAEGETTYPGIQCETSSTHVKNWDGITVTGSANAYVYCPINKDIPVGRVTATAKLGVLTGAANVRCNIGHLHHEYQPRIQFYDTPWVDFTVSTQPTDSPALVLDNLSDPGRNLNSPVFSFTDFPGYVVCEVPPGGKFYSYNVVQENP